MAPIFEVTGTIAQVGQLSDGTYVVAGGSKVTLHGSSGGVKGTFDGEGFVLAPDGRRLVIWGPALLLVTAGDPAPRTLATAQAEQSFGPADFSPEGGAVAYTRSVPGGGALAVVTLGDGRVSGFSASPGRYPRVFFAGDGKSVAFNRVGPEVADEPEVLVVRFAG